MSRQTFQARHISPAARIEITIQGVYAREGTGCIMKQNIQWGRLFRRGLALFMATVAVWLLITAAGMGAATGAIRALGTDPDFITAALTAELGPLPGGSHTLLDPWGRLAVGQSAYLLGGEDAVAAQLAARPDPTAAPTPAGDSPSLLDDGDGDNAEALPETTTAPSDIVAQTLGPKANAGYVSADGVYVANRSKQKLDIAAVAAAPVEITLPEEGPQILIMHSHACEAYTPDGEDVYIPSDASRTLDTNYNVVRIGNEMKAVFEEMGLSVIHDESLYDYPSYNAAYTNARAGIEKYLEEYPSIQIVLDIHRDALIGTDGTVYKAVTTIDGQPTAQVMLVVGSDDKGGHPEWRKNLALAFRLEKTMNLLYPTLARPITLRSSHYNQYFTTGSLLVEVGCHGNTLQEAINGGRLFARAAGAVLLGLEE